MDAKTRWELLDMGIEDPDSLPKCTSVGCYPLFYLDEEDNVLCAGCAQEHVNDDGSLSNFEPNWEDPMLYCDQCSSRIESAYAEDN